MTVKELSEFTGKTERTVRNWISKAGDKINPVPYETISQGVPHQYNVDEVEIILNSGSMSKDAVRILMENARKNQQIEPIQNVQGIDYNALGAIIASSVAAAISPLIKEIISERDPVKIDGDKSVYLPEPTPEINLRDRLRKSINDYSLSHFDGDRREAWNSLYQEIYYRMHRNVRLSAKNRNMQKLDYLESENLLINSIAIVEDLMSE